MVPTVINTDNVIKEKTRKHNPNQPDISDHPYKYLKTGGCGSGKKFII